MTHNDVQDELQEGFEPGSLPPIGPDGALQLPMQRPVTEPPPRLCEAGPCINYHRFEIQLDVTRPIADAVEPGGRLVGKAPPMPFHVETHHYCYPTSGIETKLGELPVLTCNRWQPITGDQRAMRERIQEEFFASDDGHTYRTALDAWLAKQTQEQADVDAIAVEASTEEPPRLERISSMEERP